MTTLSKEDVVRLAGSVGIDPMLLDAKQISHLESFANLACADLVAENERLKEELQQVTISKDCYFEERNSARAAFHGRVKEVESMQSELTVTRTALAAAEAREKLQIDALLTCQKKQINECAPSVNYKTFDSDLVAKAIAQPRDDSALREMIAGVYEECAKVCDLFEQKADALNDSIADDDDANKGRSEYIMGKATASSRIANAIRALEEKKLASLTS